MKKLTLTILALLVGFSLGFRTADLIRDRLTSFRVEKDGHKYIVIQSSDGLGAVHDPDCPCREKGGEE